MPKALLAVILISAAAFAQVPAPQTPPPTPAPAAEPPKPAGELDEVRREVDAKIEDAKKEIKEVREEVRAQMATQSAAQGWEDDWVPEERKLELFVPDGYFRVRPDLFNKFDLGRLPDPSGYTIFPRSPTSDREHTVAGVNMRFRFEPTFNISEQVRLRMQIDALDNVLFGSTPDYAFSRTNGRGNPYDRDEFVLLSESQTAPRSGINALSDSIALKRVYGEVSTPVGILRFGRMGSHWGLGMQRNDGNCIDCDHGDTVDRLMFVSEPFTGFYVTPMLDFNAEGPTSTRTPGKGQPFDLSNSDDSHSFILALARRDTEQQARTKLDEGRSVFNYGIHFTYRVQRNDPADFYGNAFVNEGGDIAPVPDPLNPASGNPGDGLNGTYVLREGTLYVPNLWLKFERKVFRLELEAAAVLGSINNRARTAAVTNEPGANQALNLMQLGAVAQGEYRFMDGALRLSLELGVASGDKAPGLGNYPRRKTGGTDNTTQPGDIDGPQYACHSTGGCSDSYIRNFRFNPDYRVDMILFREILGGVTDAVYSKPTLTYRVAEGFDVYASIIYSRALYAQSTPSFDGTRGDANLGVEINAGTRFETEDGFIAGVAWGVLFPLGGLAHPDQSATGVGPDTAHAFRGMLGVKF